jgi:endonuclease-3
MITEFPVMTAFERIRMTVADLPQPLIDQMTAAGPFKVLIATILSLRTRDETTATVTPRLWQRAETPAQMLEIEQDELASLIYPVGFYRQKARDIRAICHILITRYNGDVPSDMDALLSLPGVGRKTANLVLAIGFGIPAICVDIHVHRICNRWGYLTTNTPEETEMALRAHIPESEWIAINGLLVTFGQHICHPVSPRCSLCPVADICAQKAVTRRR